MIVEHEQQGAQRAEYGKTVLKTLSERLTAEFGRGFSKSNLEYMRRFYQEYRNRMNRIAQMPSGQLKDASAALIPEQTAPAFPLAWSQYVFLLSLDDPAERHFYEIEASA